MFYRYIYVFYLLTIYLFGNTLIDSKVIDGTLYKIIESDAKIMPNFDAKGNKLNDYTLVFTNSQGKVAVSKNIHTQMPSHYANKIKIYYLENEKNYNEQMYEIFFNKNDIHFPQYDLTIENSNYKNITPLIHKSSASYSIEYYILFILFTVFAGFSSMFLTFSIPSEKIDRRIRIFAQFIIIIIFFIGVDNILKKENLSCYKQDLLSTIGTVKYHVYDQPYVIFKNCNGDNSRSQMNIKALDKKSEYSPVNIYYFKEDQKDWLDNRGHVFTYKVYLDKESALQGKETPLRIYFAWFMLLLVLLDIRSYRKETSVNN